MGSSVATVAMFLIVVFMWRDLSRTKQTAQEIQLQNRNLSGELANAAADLAAANRRLDQFTQGGPPPGATPAKTLPRKIALPAEAPETLFLQQPVVKQTADGLVARFEFQPDDAVPLPERVTLVVRVPDSSPSRILSLVPVAAPDTANLECILNAKGNLAMVEGAPAELAALVFELTVSGPAKTTVRGSKGIKPFEMDIRPDGCTVRKL